MIARAAWRSHLRHPWLALLSMAGIALGVAVSVAIQLANQSARDAFDRSVSEVVGAATHQVAAGSAGLDERAYAGIRAAALAVGGFAAPVVEAQVALVDEPGRVVRLIGVDPFAEGPFRAAIGALGAQRGFRLDRFLSEPGSAVASADPGPLRIRYGTARHELTVIARLADARAADLVVVDIATAQELLGRVGRLDRVDVRLPPGATIPVPPGAELVPAAQRGDALRQLTAAFHTNLTALGLIALVVGMFLIANTAGFAVVRRRALFARLRAHGATPGQILRLVLGEALIAGAIASFLGALLGMALARLLVGLVGRTIGDLYAAVGPLAVGFDPLVLIQGIALGTVATVLAAAWPALEAARTRPRLGLLRSEPEHAAARALPWLVAVGLGSMALGGAVIALLPAGILPGFIGMGLLLVGAAALVPPLLAPLTRLLAWPVARHPLAALATRAIAANRSRTGIAVAALSIACAAALGMTLMVSSFRRALDTWLGSTLTADVYVSAPRLIAARVGDAPLAADLVARRLAVVGIAAASPTRAARVATGQGEVDLAAFDPLPRSAEDFPARPAFASGAERDRAWAAFATGAVFVTEPFATHHGVRSGDVLRLRTPDGERPVPIAAVVVDYSNDRGAIYLHLARYREWYHDDGITALALYAAPGVAPEELAKRVRQAAGDAPLSINVGATLKSASLQVFDRTFAITAVIRWLAAGVAVLGLIAALAAVQLDRARTTARLRAIGLTPRGVIALATAECVLTGTAAGLLAIPIGIGVAAGLTHVINRRSFGWSMDLSVDPWQLVLTVALAAGAAAIAGLLPAWRASRQRIAEALHEE